MSTLPILLVHGGAWAIPDDMVEAHLRGVRAAVAAGWRAIEQGASALDAVEAALVVMEDDETFDAGRGSFLTRDGRVQLDALMMDGGTLRAGGVGCVERIRNPIRAARKVLEESPHVYFVGEGAERFAQEHGIELCRNEELVIEREVRRLKEFQANPTSDSEQEIFTADLVEGNPGSPATSHDTVGAVALDAAGNIAAATSTGGTLNKAPGRVGDSSLIGCGCYADNLSAAVSTTGWGEPMMKLVLGKWAADLVAAGKPPDMAAPAAITYLKSRLNGHGGMILLDAKGHYGIAHNTPRMAWARKSAAGEAAGIQV
ncbi:MAG: isoaspartyl peptidase/L-asparaginase [Acidobacteriota bacterium]|nr:isoaspartyl peptidase/L-asparaginase [Acidobacteriota bacterium]